MRDGVELRTRIWTPEAEGPFPVVLERGYRPGNEGHAAAFNAAGYAYVGQQARGNLEGGMFRTDDVDGYDCVQWISEQPWCDGNVAMYGPSFMGATQWLTAPEGHPNLKAIVPQVISTDLWERGYWDHGALQLSHVARRIYRTVVSPDATHKVEEFGGWDAFYRHMPLITLDETVVGSKNRLWQEYVSHSRYDDYWREVSLKGRVPRVRIPVYIHDGWYDNYPAASFEILQTLKESGHAADLRILVDPTDHLGDVVGDRDFGDDPTRDRLDLAIRWLDYVVRGIDNGLKDEPPITIFVMGINQWRGEREWPLARTEFANYYLHAGESRHGSLDTMPPGDEPPSRYTYDPEDPVPTLGGNHSGPQDHPEIIRVGALDQRPNWDRSDVLVFSTAPLEEDTEVTGPVRARLYAASSAPDTDFIVRLIDVYPDGTAYNLTEGIIRARFREGVWGPPRSLAPGEVYRYDIELQPTSNVFLKGHRICVHVTSSSFPLWDRNPNTGHPQGMDAEMRVAHQTVFHDSARPSHIVLPIIPGRGESGGSALPRERSAAAIR
jgi:putative CocE/NonD family hydrolase